MISQERLSLLLLLLLFFLFGIFYTFDNPLYLKPDEPYHYEYVRYLLAGNGLPAVDLSKIGVGAHSALEAEGHQPPIYYSTVATVAWLFDFQDQRAPAVNPHFMGTLEGNRHQWNPLYASPFQVPIFLSGRLISLLCGAIAVFFAYLLLNLYLSAELAFFAAGLMALNPQFIFMATSFSNDMASVMTIHIGLWMIGATLKRGSLSRRQALWLGIVLALATLTKLGGLGLFLPLGVVVLWLCWQRKSWEPFFASALSFFAWFVLCSWWLWRNWQLYHDPLTTTLLPILLGPRVEPFTMQVLQSYLAFVWKAYWLDFSPGGILFAEPIVYWGIGLLCIVALIGSLLALIRQPLLRPLFALLCFWFVFMLVSLLRLTSGTAVFMGGGRLLFPAAVAVSGTLALGLAQVGIRGWLAKFLLLLWGLFALIAPFRYLHTTYPRPQLVTTLAHEPMVPIHAHFADDTFELIGYDLAQPKRMGNEEILKITYYWRVVQGSGQDFSLFVQWLDPQKMVPIAQIDSYPGNGGYPTSLWQPNQIFVDTVHLHLSLGQTKKAGVLLTGLYDLSTMQRLLILKDDNTQAPRNAICLAKTGTTALLQPLQQSSCPPLDTTVSQ